ncbi:MAG: hypothetical protein ACREF7_00525 [Candidatus Saccharimonadales bacterium]
MSRVWFGLLVVVVGVVTILLLLVTPTAWPELPRSSRERRKLATHKQIAELEHWHELWQREDGIQFGKQLSECRVQDPYGYGAECLLGVGHAGLHEQNYGDGWVSKWA